MNIDPHAAVSDIILSHPPAARVLERYAVDTCAAAALPLDEVLSRRGIDTETVCREMIEVCEDSQPSPVPPDSSVPELVDLLMSRHHEPVKQALPSIAASARKVASVHGAREPRLLDVSRVVDTVAHVLGIHFGFEEGMLFPLLRAPASPRESVASALAAMMEQHRRIGWFLDRLEVLTDDFTAPDWACVTYRTLMNELRWLRDDTREHVHTENELLAVKALGTGPRA